MRYGVFADIHGNLEAYEAVTAALDQEKVDTLLCLGDIVGYGADPKACIAKTRELGCLIVAGNHDYAAVDKVNVDFFNTFAREAAVWTRANLPPTDREFLRNLRLVETVNGITLVHSTPHYPELFEYIQTSFDAHLGFEMLTNQLCFVGHSHVPVTFFRKRAVTYAMDPVIKIDPKIKTMVNVGSVGQPRDENPAAAYAVYDSTAQTVHIKRVQYDIEKAVTKIVKAGLPEILGERLRYGR
ncbi:MAG: metallophosphoesterase family protein [Planctomycetota bacterium]|nr:metallophosphoesterase family protein [Planctomycetota bacterium]